MKNISIRISRLLYVLAPVLFMVCLAACKKQDVVYNTSSDVNITGYLDNHPEQFSEFRKILDRTGTASFLNAYGAYTLFLPNNDAVKAYLQQVGKSSVEDVNLETLKGLVRFHLLEDTLTTGSFKDGKLPALTMYGQYLTTGASNTSGVTKTRINRQANLVQGNIVVGNGIIHVIDDMLIPASQSLAEMIKSNANYSIFSEALQATKLYDTLNILPANNPDKKRAWLTVLAQTDSVFHAAGINTYQDLVNKYSNTGNPEDPKDSLHLFMDYHILYDAKYLADIISAGSHPTLAPLEVITSKLQGTDVLINDDDFNGQHEPGIKLNRSSSDISATNGVLHSTAPYIYDGVQNTGSFAIKVRRPVRIDWDVADFPDLRKLNAYFRKKSYSFAWNAMSEITSDGGAKSKLYYTYSANDQTWWRDHLELPLGLPFRNAWWEFTTPLIVRGKYKVWANYEYHRKSSSQKAINSQVTIDGVPLQRTLDEIAKRPAGSDAELEAQGWKQYTNGTTSSNYNGRLLGIVTIKTTDRHKLRITWVNGSSGDLWLDMIQFIPADDPEQVWPRFNPDGTLADKP